MGKFKEISVAHQVLSDPTERARYDRGEGPSRWTCKRESSWEKEMRKYREEAREYEEEIYELRKGNRSINRECHKSMMSSYDIQSFACGSQVQYYYLFKNIELGNLEECCSLIDKVEVTHDDFKYLAKCAILYERKEIFNLFKERVEISPNDILSYVSQYKSEEFFDYFLSKYLDELDINHKDEKENTALHHTLEWFSWNESKHQSFVESLLSKGARLDVKNKEGKTPFDLLLSYAQEYPVTKGVERLNNVSALLSYCKFDELKKLEGTPALNGLVELAAKYHHEGIFNLLAKNDTQISSLSDEDGNTALHYALTKFTRSNGHEYESFARFLLSKGARLDVKNKEGKTPFDLLVNYVKEYLYDRWSFERNANGTYDFIAGGLYSPLQRLDLVVWLLSKYKGILEGLNGTPALNKLVDIVVDDCNHKEALDLLVENNIQISSTTLEKIVTRDFNEKIFGCFLHKNKVGYQDENGNTALHHALRYLHYYSSMFCKVESLVSAGARFDVKNGQDETPFDFLIKYVEGGFCGQTSRLNYAWKLLNKCENKDILRELKYKDGTLALSKLNELRIKCRNTSIIVASTLAVVGVALGVAIAVHLEMLAVGIGIGAVCCLVASAIICYCNRPLDSLENSSAEAVVNQTSVVEL